MKAYQITDLKSFMSLLLTTSLFDEYLLEEATITTYNVFRIDGRIRAEFYTKEEQEDKSLCPYEFTAWKDMRSHCFALIKGKRTPLQFQFVFLLNPAHMERLLSSSESTAALSSIRALTLTVRYENGSMTLITGISTSSFMMDREPEQLWDRTVSSFLSEHAVSFELL